MTDRSDECVPGYDPATGLMISVPVADLVPPPDDDDPVDDERTQGERTAWLTMLRTCLQHLGWTDTSEAEVARLRIQREQAVAALRLVCEQHGDNDWPDDLSLADVIERHLAQHLD